MPLELDRIDHIHVFVTDRPAAEKWYREIMVFRRKAELEMWAVPHGPLMLQNESGSVVLALFEHPRETNRSIIAFGVAGSTFLQWVRHLTQKLDRKIAPVDHGVAWSLYFSDLDENPYEITTYDYSEVSSHLTGIGV